MLPSQPHSHMTSPRKAHMKPSISQELRLVEVYVNRMQMIPDASTGMVWHPQQAKDKEENSLGGQHCAQAILL